MLIRARTDTDMVACELLAQEVQSLDGYPPYLPASDLRAFLQSPDAVNVWVAEDLDHIVGHVALHAQSSQPVMDVASEALHRSPDQLGVIARLNVKPSARGRGLGRRLLDVATEAAFARDLWPILDVVTQFLPAIRLYESSNWRRVGQVTVHLSDGHQLDEFVYVAPPP